MRYVLDASITITWAMQDVSHPVADLAWSELDEGSALVPGIWWYEVRNILVVNERRQWISIADSARFLERLHDFQIDGDNQPDSTHVLTLARSTGLTVYDCSYLELAMREHAPLATLDKRLQQAAASLGVLLLDDPRLRS
jgi:predicted nucleic acid-binding protein